MLELPSKEASDGPEGGEAAARASHGQRFWGALLVLDSFFVIIFGGALAAKLYQHWTPAPIAAVRRAPRPKPVTPAAAVPEAPKAPEPAKAPEAPAKAADGAPPPKPSLLAEAPKRAPATPQGPAAAKAPEPAKPAPSVALPAGPAAKVKAVPVDFTLKAPGAKKVELAGAFIVRGGRKPMVEQGGGVWTLTLYLTPASYRYHFVVDGKKVLDPAASKTERGSSVVAVP